MEIVHLFDYRFVSASLPQTLLHRNANLSRYSTYKMYFPACVPTVVLPHV